MTDERHGSRNGGLKIRSGKDRRELIVPVDEIAERRNGYDRRVQNELAAKISLLLSDRSESAAHTDHPARHWDRTCPACIAEGEAPVSASAVEGLAGLALDRMARAHKLVHDLCQGTKKWRMSVPVQQDDPDIVLADALNTAEQAIKFLLTRSSTGATGEADRAHNAIHNLGRSWVDRYNEMYRIAQNLDTALKSQIEITNTERAAKEQLERELAEMTADRDMWLKDSAKQNDALGRVIAERDALRSSTASSEEEAMKEIARLLHIDYGPLNWRERDMVLKAWRFARSARRESGKWCEFSQRFDCTNPFPGSCIGDEGCMRALGSTDRRAEKP